MFAEAIVRGVPKTLDAGITSADLGKPDRAKAMAQHCQYVQALEECGLEVTALDADEKHPDSVFIEDTAVVTGRCAILARPGADSRRGEVHGIEEALSGRYENIERIGDPGTLDGGDVLQVRDHFYIGLTSRTNREGARQLSEVLRSYGYGASPVETNEFLHLKSGVSYLGDEDLVVAGELAASKEFGRFDKIIVDSREGYFANCIRVNDHVLVAAGSESAKALIAARGYEVIELEMSEFRKIDGGLSCLSLRLPGRDGGVYRTAAGGEP
ncbi:MAG: N(G),N(G)-dimethylarginine dimethylaminohydrolase [Rubrobacter sp.]|nr:N(G),N(G)-dimethylarginine dimethylaminohydrolase [Rubrobacter sp.]